MDLFPQLLSPDNAVRSQAETRFEQLKQQPDACVSLMMEALTSSPLPHIRALIAVLLRSSIFVARKNMWPQLSPALQSAVKQALLQAVTKETLADNRHKLVDTTSELAGNIFQLTPQSSARDWPELLSFMFQAASSPQAEHRESSYRMFTRLANFVCDALTPQQMETVKTLFANGLNEDSIPVRLAAMSASISFIEFNFDDASKKQFQKLLPKMAEVISRSLSQHKEEDAQTAIGMFVELAESEPLFFRPVIGNFCELMAKIITTQSLDDNTRQVALEFLVTICETKPGMMRKIPNFVPSLMNICMALLLEVEDDNAWLGRTSENVEVTNSDVASESLDRLCIAFTGRVLVPIFQKLLPPMLQNSDWKQRYAALQTMCIMGEGCNAEVGEEMGAFVQLLLPYFSDPHPRVRYTAFNTLGQMCTDFGPFLQEEFHIELMPRLLQQLESETVPKVQSHACACIVNWCENLDPLELAPYINRMMTAIGLCISNGAVVVQEQALVSLAAVADCSQEKFLPYYDAFMPLCKTVMLRATGKNFRELQGKAIDAITIMASAVGAEKFKPDAAQILPAMMELQKSNMTSDDPMLKHLMQGWARVCRCLKEHFVTYLPVVMPALLRSAGSMPEVLQTTQDNFDSLRDEGSWDFREMAGESFAVKTSASEEKALACNMIFCYAHDLEEHFMPYVSDCAKIMVPLLNYYLDDSTRQAVAGAIPQLLNCVVQHVKKRGGSDSLVGELWRGIFPVLCESIDAEQSHEVLISKTECLRDAFEILGVGCLDHEQTKSVMVLFMQLTMSCLQRKSHLSVREEEEDFDDVEREMLDAEQQVNEVALTTLADLHCQLIKVSPSSYMDLLGKLQVEGQALLQLILLMTEKPITNTDLQIAICMMDDIIEFGGPGSSQLLNQFIPCLMKNMNHAAAEIRQAAVYGIGVFFQVSPENATDPKIINNMVAKLHSLITAKNSRKKAAVMATENAISAFGKALEFKSSCLETEKSAVEAFVAYLPVSKDREEARVTYARFLNFVANNRKFIFGDNFALLPKVISTLVTILGSKLVEKELNPKILQTLKMLQSNLPGPAIQGAFAALSPDLQEKLSEYK